MEKFEEGARRADKDPSEMPRMIQLHVSWAEDQEEAEQQAVREWPNGGMPFPKADIRNPEDFAAMAKQVSVENFVNRVLMSADLDEHLEHIQHYVDLGFDEVYVHNVGRNQEEFIRAYGERVIPKLHWPRRGVARMGWRNGGYVSVLLVAVGAAMWGTDGVLRVPLLEVASPSQIVLLEHLVLLVYSVPAVVLGWRFFRGLGAAQWVALLIIGWGGSAIATLLFTTAFAVGNPTVVILLQKTQPLFAIALAGILLRERLGWAYWPCFAVAMVGAYMISFGDLGPFDRSWLRRTPPAALALGAALLWGSSTVLGGSSSRTCRSTP